MTPTTSTPSLMTLLTLSAKVSLLVLQPLGTGTVDPTENAELSKASSFKPRVGLNEGLLASPTAWISV